MTDRAKRIAAALVVGLTAPTAMTACMPGGGGGMSDDQVARSLESSVLAAVPLADEAYVGFASAGSPTSRSVRVRIYVSSEDAAALAEAADSTFETIWREMPVRPSNIGFQAYNGAKPSNPSNGSRGNIDLAEVHDAFGAGYLGLAGQVLSLDASELAEHYGAWTGPAAQ